MVSRYRFRGGLRMSIIYPGKRGKIGRKKKKAKKGVMSLRT